MRHVRMNGWWTSVLGVITVAAALREIFTDLFQPSGSGTLSSFLGRWLFRLARKLTFLMPIAGPLTLVLVIGCWTFLLASGFALIYLSAYPGQFTVAGPPRHGFAEFINLLAFSLAALTTVGTPDLTPNPDWIRLAVAVESLLGFSLVTASISWIVLIYPALGRMRSLARKCAVLIKAGESSGEKVVTDEAASLLSELAASVISTRVDLIHYPLIYYFHSDAERASLPMALLMMTELAKESGQMEGARRVRLHAAMLQEALTDLAGLLARRFVPADANDPQAVFRAFAEDHLIAERQRNQDDWKNPSES